jgi:hypothetical protein
MLIVPLIQKVEVGGSGFKTNLGKVKFERLKIIRISDN